VQCPSCGTTFEAPLEDPRPAPPVVSAGPLPGRGPRDEERSRDLEFDPSRRDRDLSYRNQKDLEAAAFWLRQLVFVDLIASVGCCCPVSLSNARDTGEALVVIVIATLILLYLPLLFVALGAYYLRTRRVYGMAMTGGIMALVIAVLTLGQTAFTAFASATVQINDPRPGGLATCSLLVLSALALYGTVAGCVGGTKTLMVLSRPEVYRAFR
jgi:hypothetical protein